ncbi:MAG TPA: branched-chain amino acid ABC transporter permease [Actinomycetota bacterium]|nr:branched-chain amino acid ABC transporter permease [Actinomycetota bacterium]
MTCVTNVVDQFWDQTRNGLTLGAIYAMLALGYTMVYGVLQLINFAHSEIFMIGTVVTLYAIRNWFGLSEPVVGIGLVLVIIGVLIPAMLASGGAAVLLERLAYRPLRRRGAPRLSFLISAIGASLFIQYLFVLMDGNHYILFVRLPAILGPSPAPIPDVWTTHTVFTLFGTNWTNKQLSVILGAVAMLFVLDRFVRTTRLGRGIRAVAQDPEVASMMGVNIDRIVVTTFFVGGLMAGAAGVMYVLVLGVPAFWFIGFIPGIKAFTAAVLGGIGNIRGAMLGGILLGMVEAYAVPCFGADWIDVTAFAVLVLVLLFRPTGLLGEQVHN